MQCYYITKSVTFGAILPKLVQDYDTNIALYTKQCIHGVNRCNKVIAAAFS